MIGSDGVTREHQGHWLSTAGMAGVFMFILFIVVFVG